MLTLHDLATSAQEKIRKPEVQAALHEIVLGPEGSLRRTLPAGGLTCAEQVDVLVEQETDLNIVGRAFIGWAPWL